MNPGPRFLSVEDVIALHQIAIEDQGGDPALRDRALLESALAVPKQQYDGTFLHPDIPAMAAAYAFHVCRNHPFVDGNKRAAIAAMIAFLIDNGWAFEASANEAEPAIFELAAGTLDKDAFTAWAKSHMREKSRLELRDFFSSLSYHRIADFMRSGLMHDDPAQAHSERTNSMLEASRAIPAINEANIGAMHAEQQGDQRSAEVLRAQSQLLCAIYRLAEDQGYEW